MPEYLILDAIRGPLSGQSFSIPTGGSLVIGRLPECGVPITQDPTVSRQQCRIEYPGPDAQLVHLSQTSDTLVNSSPATRVELRRGDTIEVGSGNSFRVRMDASPAPAAAKPAGGGAKAGAGVRYSTAPASSGWCAFRFPEGIEGPAPLLKMLASSAAPRAVVDFARAGGAPGAADPAWQPLFPWFAADQQLQFSPMIVPAAVAAGFPDFLKAAWGKDALVFAGSKLDDAAFLAHWQKISGVEDNQPGKTLSVFYWPTLLQLVLTCQTPAMTEPVLSGLSWIVVEDLSASGQVVLFAPPSFTEELGRLGFAPEATSTTVASPNKD